jgi:hypothetical protein
MQVISGAIKILAHNFHIFHDDMSHSKSTGMRVTYGYHADMRYDKSGCKIARFEV